MLWGDGVADEHDNSGEAERGLSDGSAPAVVLSDLTAEALIDRMRAGDRAAAAAFMERYRTRIRHRIRWKLAADMRRLFDSQEILSTVGRRLDDYVREGKVRARTPGELHQFILRVADSALKDKARRFRRLQRLERPGLFASALQSPLASGGREEELEDVREQLSVISDAIEDEIDHQIFQLRQRGMSHTDIAREVGLSPESVRQRWSQLRRRIRARHGEQDIEDER